MFYILFDNINFKVKRTVYSLQYIHTRRRYAPTLPISGGKRDYLYLEPGFKKLSFCLGNYINFVISKYIIENKQVEILLQINFPQL